MAPFASLNVSGLTGLWLEAIPDGTPVGEGTAYQHVTQDLSKMAWWNWLNGDQDFRADCSINLNVTPPDGYDAVAAFSGSGIINEDFSPSDPDLHPGPGPDFTYATVDYPDGAVPMMWFERYTLGDYTLPIYLGSRLFKEDVGTGTIEVSYTGTITATLRPGWYEYYAIDATDTNGTFYPGYSYWRSPRVALACVVSWIIGANTTIYSADPADGEIIVSATSVQVGPDASAYSISPAGYWTSLMADEGGEPDATASDTPVPAAPDTPGTARPEDTTLVIGKYGGGGASSGLVVNEFQLWPREYFGPRTPL